MSDIYKKYKLHIGIGFLVIIILLGIYNYIMNQDNGFDKYTGENSTVPFEQELQDILIMQETQGMDSIMNKDCSNYKLPESISYCESEQKYINSFK